MTRFHIKPMPSGGYSVICTTERTVAGPFKTFCEVEAAFIAFRQQQKRLQGRELTAIDQQAILQLIDSGLIGPEYMRGES